MRIGPRRLGRGTPGALTRQLDAAYTALVARECGTLTKSRTADGLHVIVETIVTTVADDGAVNCAPMGVEWGEGAIVLKPFLETTTYRNVVATGAAVVNLTDDVRVFARAAIGNPAIRPCPRWPSAASCSPIAARGANSRCGRSTARRRDRAST